MINRLFESLSTTTFTTSVSKRIFDSFSQFIIEIYSKISESILQMRFDKNNAKQFLTKNDAGCKFFQLSLKKVYKTHDLILEKLNLSAKHEIFIEIFFQSKNDSNRFLIERWTLSKSTINPQNDSFDFSEKNIGKVSIFMRSLLCLLCTTPLWKLNLMKNSQSLELLKKTFLDYSFFFEIKNKSHFECPPQKILSKEINLEISQKFSLKLKLEYLKDFSNLMENVLKPKQILRTEEKGFKRQRFLSEGFPYNLENNVKSDNSTNDSLINNSGIFRCDSDNFCKQNSFDEKPRSNQCGKTQNKKKGERHKNLMSRKDSLILLSNNAEKKGIKILDDEGEEIEIEYVDENKKDNDFCMQIIKEQEKEDNEILMKEKILKEGIFEQDEDYVVLKFNNDPKENHYIENMIQKINDMKNHQEKLKKAENGKNIKDEMNEITKFYLSLLKEQTIDN